MIKLTELLDDRGAKLNLERAKGELSIADSPHPSRSVVVLVPVDSEGGDLTG